MKKKKITRQCVKCGEFFDSLYTTGPKPKYCKACKTQPKEEDSIHSIEESFIQLKKNAIAEIKILLEEINGIQIYRLEHPNGKDPDYIDDDTLSQDFDRLERLIDMTCKINIVLEERGEKVGD